MKKLFSFLTLLLISASSFSQTDTLNVPPPPGAEKTDTALKIFEKVEVEASYPGGDAAWKKYLQSSSILSKAMRKAMNKKIKPGEYTVWVQFIVGKEGKIESVKALTNHGYGLEEAVVKLISEGGTWMPARLKGRTVKAYRKQPVTFTFE